MRYEQNNPEYFMKRINENNISNSFNLKILNSSLMLYSSSSIINGLIYISGGVIFLITRAEKSQLAVYGLRELNEEIK